MPYIKREFREPYDYVLDKLESIETKGDLEYCVFKLMKKFMSTRKYRYNDLHDCIKAVEHSAHEFERRFLDPREDKAIQENGDIE
jgi:hypothetical protein